MRISSKRLTKLRSLYTGRAQRNRLRVNDKLLRKLERQRVHEQRSFESVWRERSKQRIEASVKRYAKNYDLPYIVAKELRQQVVKKRTTFKRVYIEREEAIKEAKVKEAREKARRELEAAEEAVEEAVEKAAEEAVEEAVEEAAEEAVEEAPELTTNFYSVYSRILELAGRYPDADVKLTSPFFDYSGKLSGLSIVEMRHAGDSYYKEEQEDTHRYWIMDETLVAYDEQFSDSGELLEITTEFVTDFDLNDYLTSHGYA